MLTTTYIGFSNDIIKLFLKDERYALRYVITSSNRLSEDTINELVEHNIQLFKVNNKSDLVRAFDSIECDIVLIYKFGMIIPDEIVNRYEMYNIHCGDLRTNRGAHSLRWTILLGESATKITLYQIDGVDEGIVIDEPDVPVTECDDVISIADKMDKYLPVLLSSLYKYHGSNDKSNYKRIENGIYRKKIKESDYHIDLETDSYEKICRKINCVKDFGGATIDVDGKKYRAYDVRLSESGLQSINVKSVEKRIKDKEFVIVYYHDYVFE